MSMNVAETITHLRESGKKVFFVTNTSSRSSEQLQQKLTKLGEPCEVNECIPSGVFTASYVKRTHPEARRVYVIGGNHYNPRRIERRCQACVSEEPRRSPSTFNRMHPILMRVVVSAATSPVLRFCSQLSELG